MRHSHIGMTSSAALLMTLVFMNTSVGGLASSVVRSPGQALSLFRNSHSTAIARLAELHSVRKRDESAHVFIATCWMYAQYCECDQPGKPMLWRIGYGLQRLFAARGWKHTVVTERCRYSPSAGDRATFTDYAGAIARNHPVILTFCYDPITKQSLAIAKRRVDKCFSVVGIGYVTAGNGKKLLICQDGLALGQSSPANVDKVSPAKVGLATRGAIWNQPATGLYKWDGSYSNLVMVFVGTPAK